PYDYIGAPWFEGWERAPIDAPIIGVGNSGFSLLRLDSFRSFSILTKLRAKEWPGHCDHFLGFSCAPSLAHLPGCSRDRSRSIRMGGSSKKMYGNDRR